jgi:hypothetical protein
MHINCVVRTNFNPGCASLLRSPNRSRYISLGYVCAIGVSWPAGSESNTRNMTA